MRFPINSLVGYTEKYCARVPWANYRSDVVIGIVRHYSDMGDRQVSVLLVAKRYKSGTLIEIETDVLHRIELTTEEMLTHESESVRQLGCELISNKKHISELSRFYET